MRRSHVLIVASAVVLVWTRSAHGEEPSDEVVVAGTRLSHTAGSAQIVPKEQLERFGYDDPGAVLLQVPGVTVRGEDGIGLRPNIGIRGSNPDRSKKLTLMEDGVLFGPAPYSAPAAYYFPLVTRMTQVRVVKGPAAIAYGPHTVGGAIDFLSRPVPGRTSAALDLAAGEYGYQKLHGWAGGRDGQLGFLVEGVRLQNTGFTQLPGGADTGSTRNDWMVKLAYDVAPDAPVKHRLQLKLSYADEVSNETYLGQTDFDFRTNPYRRYAASALDQMKNHRTGVVATHTIEGRESSYAIKTQAYRFGYARTWRKLNRLGGGSVATILTNAEDPAYSGHYAVLTGQRDSSSPADTLYIGPNQRQFVSEGIQSVLSTHAATGPVGHRFEAGVRFHYDHIARRHSETGFMMVGGQLVPADEAEIVTAENLHSTHAIAVHLTDAIEWRGLTVTPGARVELISSRAEDYRTGETRDALVPAIMPGAGAFYEIIRSFGVLAGVHRGFSPPPPGSDAHVRPEYSVDYEAGARWARGRSRAEVIAFSNHYSNLTDVCTLASGCLAESLDRQFDAGRARVEGLEVSASHALGVGSFVVPATLAYAATRGVFLNEFTSQDPIYGAVKRGDAVPYLPLHQLSVTLGAEHRRGGIAGALTYLSPMREQAGSAPIDESLATDEQLWFDFGGYVAVLDWLRLYANLRNAFGAENIAGRRPYGARPSPPRWLMAGVKATF